MPMRTPLNTRLQIFALPILLALAACPLTVLADSPDFARDIQPILRASCVECHNAKTHKAGLRLDNRADAIRGSDKGRVLVPGNQGTALLCSG